MVSFTAVIEKFKEKGEKTGWSYIEITEEQAHQLKPGHRKSFRVKGFLDNYALKQTAILPMGNGSFILPVNHEMRKVLGKRQGAQVAVQIEEDKTAIALNNELLDCLRDEPAALKYFKSLPPSHQKYYSKWVDEAKTEATKAKRILLTVKACARQMNYAEMIREQKAKGE